MFDALFDWQRESEEPIFTVILPAGEELFAAVAKR
jgi:hypothetical protein